MHKYFFVLLILLPQVTFASVYISEIFYDAVGGDEGREWIEIYNGSDNDIDISSFKLNENDQNHRISAVSEGDNTIVGSDKYAVVADNPTLFLEDNSSFSGLLFDSSFSLKNTGELLVLKDIDGVEVDSVLYDVSIGGGGDGNSLQKNNGVWVSGFITPGEYLNSGTDKEEANTNQDIEVSNTNSSTSIDYVKRGSIEADAGGDKIAPVGSFVELRGKAYGLKGEPLENARYLWNFGDGSIGEGQNIFHTYTYPGKYKVFLDVSSLDYTDSDSLIVDIIQPEIKISDVASITEGSSFVELENLSGTDLNIGLWILKYDNQSYILPKNTFLIGGSKIKIPFSITSLNIINKESLGLFYPNGSLFSFYKKEESFLDLTSKEVSHIISSKAVIHDTPDNSNSIEEEGLIEDSCVEQIANIENSGYSINNWLLVFILVLVLFLSLIFFSKKFIKEEKDNDIIDINDFSEK